MKKSKFGRWNARDFGNGLFLVIITAILTGFYELFKGGANLDWITIKPVLLAAATAGLGYLIKNLLTNSQGELLKTERSPLVLKMNAQYGKVLMLAIILSGIGLSASAQYLVPRSNPPTKEQSRWSGFFRPVDKNMFLIAASKNESEVTGWLFRPSVELTALQLIPTKEKDKVFDVSSFKSMGMGISYQHFISINGLPYNNYGFNFLILFDNIPKETTAINISAAATISTLQFITFGGGYNIGLKKFFLLTGITYNFN